MSEATTTEENDAVAGPVDPLVMPKFEREDRYTVLKISDVTEALSPDECTALIELEEKVALYRQQEGKQPLMCVVVESDWPEYEPTWKAIEERGRAVSTMR